MDIFAEMPSSLAWALGLLAVVWVALALLVPLMIESIRISTRRTQLELREINEKLDRLIEALEQRTEPPELHETHPAPAPHSQRLRREPTI